MNISLYSLVSLELMHKGLVSPIVDLIFVPPATYTGPLKESRKTACLKPHIATFYKTAI